MPARAADPGDRQRSGRGGRDPPAGRGGGRCGEWVLPQLRRAAQQQRERRAALGRELQPAGGDQSRRIRLAHHGGKAAVAQGILHDRQQFGIVARLGMDQPFGRQPRLMEAGREQVAAAHHPQHRPRPSRGEPGEEQGSGGILAPARPGRRRFVQRIDTQAAAGESPVDRVDSERQHRMRRAAPRLDGGDRLAELGKGRGHRLGKPLSSYFVLFDHRESIGVEAPTGNAVGKAFDHGNPSDGDAPMRDASVAHHRA